MINTKSNSIFKILILLGFFFNLSSCIKEEPLVFKKQPISIQDYFDCDTTDCVITEILLIHSTNDSEISKKINSEIEKIACNALNLEDQDPAKTIEKAVQRFNISYQEILKEFPEEIAPYEASINCELSFENQYLLSFLIDSYLFTGGAHGNGNSTYLNIDPTTGIPISNDQLFKKHQQFLAYAEKTFRDTYNIPINESINSTGFFFENDQFILPSSIGFSNQKVILFYNQYEISSYSEGPIELKLSKKDVASFFAINIL